MNDKKAFFITAADMYDEFGNGGVKVSRKNYGLLEEYFGRENVFLCTFPKKGDTVPPRDAITFKRTHSSVGQLFAALFGCKVYFPWKEKEIMKFINEKGIDILFIDGSVLGRIAKFKLPYKTIVFYHNIETDYAWNKVKNEGPHFLPSYWASKYNDKCGTKADKVLCLNGRDSRRLEKLYKRKADFLLPVTFTDVFDVQKTTQTYKREILFLGSLFPPNQTSIEWFIKEVMPALDNVTLNIVGKGFERMKQKYEEFRNVHVIGSVNEPDEYYYRHAAVVLPIKYGAGMKVKTAEAMMYGRKIFASDEALEGYSVDDVHGIIRCNTASDYVDAINRYFNNNEQKQYEEDVRKCFLDNYETNIVKAGFFKELDELFF